MPGGAQGPLGMLRASQMVQQLLPGGHVPLMPQPEEEKKPQFITELEINDFPQHARWKVRLHHSLNQLHSYMLWDSLQDCFLQLSDTDPVFTRYTANNKLCSALFCHLTGC